MPAFEPSGAGGPEIKKGSPGNGKGKDAGRPSASSVRKGAGGETIAHVGDQKGGEGRKLLLGPQCHLRGRIIQ